MKMNFEHYNTLANLFRYPEENYKNNAKKCSSFIKCAYPTAYETAQPFFEYIKNENIQEIEELFGKTFHIQAICYLDIGYVLFAEDYKRGEFLVKMKAEQEKANNDCGVELADNLPNVLSLIPLFEDEFRKEFMEKVLSQALKKMIQEFDIARNQLKDKVRMKKQLVIIQQDLKNANIYALALRALLDIVNTDFDIQKQSDFIEPKSELYEDVLSHTKRKLPFNQF